MEPIISTEPQLQELTHLELAWSYGSTFQRNIIIPKSELSLWRKKLHGKTIYRSHWLYTSDIVDYRINNDSIAGYKGVRGLDHVLIDIDLKDKAQIGKFLDAYRGFYFDSLCAFGYEKAFLLAFSGTGFHIHVHKDSFDIAPSVDANLWVGAMIEQLWNDLALPYLADYSPDPSMYKSSQVYRMIGQLNEKSGLKKVFIDPSATSAMELIIAAKAGNHTLSKQQISEFSAVQELQEYQVEQLPTKIFQSAQKADDIVNNIVKVGHCYHDIMDLGVKAKDLYGRHNTVLRLANFYYNQSMSKWVAQDAVHKWCRTQLVQYDVEDTDRCIDSVYSAQYTFGCNDSILKTHCNSNCRIFKHRK